MLKGLGHGTYSFRIEGPGLALALKFEAKALTTSLPKGNARNPYNYFNE